MLNEAGANITEVTHRQIPQDIEEWVKRAGTGEKETKIIEKLMAQSLDGDRTALQVRLEDGRFVFSYDTVILIAHVPV